MRFAMFTLALALVSSSLGCHHNLCQQCGRGHLAGHAGGHGHVGDGTGRPTPVAHLPHGFDPNAGPPGPPTAAYAYPYYTTRGPRDFLQDNPMGIGP